MVDADNGSEVGRLRQWLLPQVGREGPLGDEIRGVCEFRQEADLLSRGRRSHEDWRWKDPIAEQIYLEWGTYNLAQLQRHWPAVLTGWKQMERVTKTTWLPTEVEFPVNRKFRIEVDDERVNLWFHDSEDLVLWDRGENTASLTAVLREATGRPYTIHTCPLDGRMIWQQR